MTSTSKQQKRLQKRQLSELEKELITLHYYIHEIIEKDRLWHNITDRQVQKVFKACKKFLSHAKGSKFETTKDQYGDKFTHVLESNLGDEGKQERRYKERESTYLTWVSFGTHHIIREFLPNWIWLKDETRKDLKTFYRPTLEALLR